jgi:hypothetical protein
MKKILYLLVLFVSANALAQSTYSIGRPLQLETVDTGSKFDSVLVRGTDKKVKYIPRSEFGSGKIPTLQEVFNVSRNFQEYGAAILVGNGLRFDNKPNINGEIETKLYLDSHGIAINRFIGDSYNSLSKININFEGIYLEKKFDIIRRRSEVQADRFVFGEGINDGSWPNSYTIDLLSPKLTYGTQETLTLPIKVNNTTANEAGNITLSSINATFTTNDGKIITVTGGIITNIQTL